MGNFLFRHACGFIFLAIFAAGSAAQNVDVEFGGLLQSGNPKSPVKIEVFYDLQCPACASFQKVLEKTERKFEGKIFVVFRHFPLRIPAHDKAIMAARVVEAAKLQGKGREMLDVVFANQKKWTSDPKAKTILFGYAAKLGIQMAQFRLDYDDDRSIRSILDDVAMAAKLKLNSTPTVFLNDNELRFAEALNLEAKVGEIVK